MIVSAHLDTHPTRAAFKPCLPFIYLYLLLLIFNSARARLHAHPHHIALNTSSQGERLVARVQTHPRSMGPKMELPSIRYFGLSHAQPLDLALVDPIEGYLRAEKPVPSYL